MVFDRFDKASHVRRLDKDISMFGLPTLDKDNVLLGFVCVCVCARKFLHYVVVYAFFGSWEPSISRRSHSSQPAAGDTRSMPHVP